MSDEILLQNILDRLEAMDGKIDRLRDEINVQGKNEVEQTVRLDKIEARMDGLEKSVQEIAAKCAPSTTAPDDATEVSQGIAAGVRLAMKNPKYLWAVILAGMSMTLGANWQDIVRTFVQLFVPGAGGVAPQ